MDVDVEQNIFLKYIPILVGPETRKFTLIILNIKRHKNYYDRLFCCPKRPKALILVLINYNKKFKVTECTVQQFALYNIKFCNFESTYPYFN